MIVDMPVEVVYIDTGDGKRFEIGRGWYSDALIPGSMGSPPITFQTQSGYKRHGVRVIDYTLNERLMAINIYHDGVDSRTEYWNNRAELLDILRPNRGQLTLGIARADGTKREIKCYPNPGATYPIQQGDSNEFDINDQIILTAHNPIWYDPDIVTPAMSESIDDNLTFPMTFPASFGASGTTFTSPDLQYTGTWKTYPKLTISGPYTTCTIRQSATNARIYLVVPITSGEKRIINLDPDDRYVQDENGNNRFSDLGLKSNLIDFAILPDGELSDGQTQVITGNFLSYQSGITNFSISFYNRYYGI